MRAIASPIGFVQPWARAVVKEKATGAGGFSVLILETGVQSTDFSRVLWLCEEPD